MLQRNQNSRACAGRRPWPSQIEKDDIMKTAGDRIIALALGAVTLSLAGAPLRAEPITPVTLKPLAAASIDAGPKHMVGYFIGSEGACRLTLMIADAPNLEQATPGTGTTRLVVPIDSGKSAQVDTSVSKTLRFACAPNGEAMTVTTIDRSRRTVD
jgi:hypothetical protein